MLWPHNLRYRIIVTNAKILWVFFHIYWVFICGSTKFDFVLYSPIKSNDVLSGCKWGLHNQKKWKSHTYVNILKCNRTFAESFIKVSKRNHSLNIKRWWFRSKRGPIYHRVLWALLGFTSSRPELSTHDTQRMIPYSLIRIVRKYERFNTIWGGN